MLMRCLGGGWAGPGGGGGLPGPDPEAGGGSGDPPGRGHPGGLPGRPGDVPEPEEASLPPRDRGFYGREAELRRVGRFFEGPSDLPGWCAWRGGGGGKTRLRQVLPGGPGAGGPWCSGAARSRGAAVSPALWNDRGAPPHPGRGDLGTSGAGLPRGPLVPCWGRPSPGVRATSFQPPDPGRLGSVLAALFGNLRRFAPWLWCWRTSTASTEPPWTCWRACCSTIREGSGSWSPAGSRPGPAGPADPPGAGTGRAHRPSGPDPPALRPGPDPVVLRLPPAGSALRPGGAGGPLPADRGASRSRWSCFGRTGSPGRRRARGPHRGAPDGAGRGGSPVPGGSLGLRRARRGGSAAEVAQSPGRTRRSGRSASGEIPAGGGPGGAGDPGGLLPFPGAGAPVPEPSGAETEAAAPPPRGGPSRPSSGLPGDGLEEERLIHHCRRGGLKMEELTQSVESLRR